MSLDTPPETASSPGETRTRCQGSFRSSIMVTVLLSIISQCSLLDSVWIKGGRVFTWPKRARAAGALGSGSARVRK
ncbi:hypothetical protein KSP39_PZI008613 [Platanthera zijinensis]|uniref:Uncharacterized protein n=1 Tax=Platanthera zijinensis TaxID=2320716 RepID=A0AAP0BP56_9ASPA